MGKVRVTKAELSKNPVNTNEVFVLRVFAYSVTSEPANERLAFILGGKKPKV